MRILIYGAGAVGCYLGGHLAGAGHQVTLLGRSSFMEPIRTSGLAIQRAGNSIEIITNLTVSTELSHVVDKAVPYDCIAFTMKAYDTLNSIVSLRSVLSEPPPIVCFQNGIGNEESLRVAFGNDQVVAATLLTAVSAPEPGIIVEEKRRGIAIALDSPASGVIESAFRETGLTVDVVQSSDSLKWSKLLLNMLGNATSAILDMLPGKVLAEKDLFEIEISAMREAIAIMSLLNVSAVDLPGAPAMQLARAIHWLPPIVLHPLLGSRIARGRGEKPPSLLLSLRARRRETEAIWLNGAVAQAAAGMNRLAPVNHALALLVTDIASGRVPWSAYRHQPERLIRAIRMAQGME